jgi:hypothetical protein
MSKLFGFVHRGVAVQRGLLVHQLIYVLVLLHFEIELLDLVLVAELFFFDFIAQGREAFLFLENVLQRVVVSYFGFFGILRL